MPPASSLSSKKSKKESGDIIYEIIISFWLLKWSLR